MTDKQELLYIDATPDEDYPIRILEAYRERANYKYSKSTGEINITNEPIMKLMNEAQDKRAEILDKAIAILREGIEKQYWTTSKIEMPRKE